MQINNGQRFDFLDRLATINLTSYESRVLISILKCHLIYNNGGVLISLSRICKATGLTTNHTCRALRGLIQKQILFKTAKQGLPFYSFSLPIRVLPIEVIKEPIRGEGGEQKEPIEVIKEPIRGGVIRTSSKETTNNSVSFKKETEERFKTFWNDYPGAWHKGIEKKALGQFLNATPEEQAEFVLAVKSYKNSKAVKDKKILSPLNFLNSPKIIKQYATEATPKKQPIKNAFEQQEEWRRRAEADPPKPGYSPKAEFEKLVKETATQKSVAKKGRT